MLQARSLLEAPSCGCKPNTVGYEAISMGTCCDVSKHARASSEEKAGSGNIGARGAPGAPLLGSAVAGNCAGQQSVGDPDLIAPASTDPVLRCLNSLNSRSVGRAVSAAWCL